jgi:hypothetical protein
VGLVLGIALFIALVIIMILIYKYVKLLRGTYVSNICIISFFNFSLGAGFIFLLFLYSLDKNLLECFCLKYQLITWNELN